MSAVFESMKSVKIFAISRIAENDLNTIMERSQKNVIIKFHITLLMFYVCFMVPCILLNTFEMLAQFSTRHYL